MGDLFELMFIQLIQRVALSEPQAGGETAG